MDSHSLSLDLLFADLDHSATLVEISIAHALAPARRMWSLPAPTDGDPEMLRVTHSRLDESTAHFDPVIRGLAFVAGLDPRLVSFANPHDIARNPSSAFLDGSFMLAMHSYDAFVRHIEGIFAPGEPTWIVGEPKPNPAAVAELRSVQDLLRRAVGPVERLGDIDVWWDMGLERMDLGSRRDLDDILHRGVHRRLIWMGSAEPILPEETPDGHGLVLVSDSGVFPADVPESMAAAIVLDFTDTLSRDRRAALCSHCGRPAVLTNQQAARARKGRPVYHQTCGREHRLRYFRDYQRRRAVCRP